MSINRIWTELEADLEWRQRELRTLANSLGGLKKGTERDWFRRTMVVMLYAHVEGYCKVALLTYVKALNGCGLCCSEVIDPVAAASFADVFHAIKFGDKKGKVFSAALPSDEKLWLIARQQEFMGRLSDMLTHRVKLSDDVVNTEDNLGAEVLRRNLFRLGFTVSQFDHYGIVLDELRNRRNNIAHGFDSSVVREADYERLRRAAFEFMDEVTLAIVDTLENERYRKNLVPPAVVRAVADAPPLA